jgi:glycogen debranching enzyme
MDTVLRDGKVVYSQGCWLLGLSGFANLLNLVDKKEARRIQSIAARLVNSIESKMWSEKSKCYVNIDSGKTTGNGSSEILYQDIIFYLFAITEPLNDKSFVTQYNNNNNNNNILQNISPEAEKKNY